jgi:predicted amidohydrolase YtcJ
VITLAIVNARVWTGNLRAPWASGIAVEGDKIVVAASSAEVAKLIAESTRVIDAKGKLVRNPAGTIERGGRADFVMLDADAISPDDAAESQIALEVNGGEVLLKRPDE